MAYFFMASRRMPLLVLAVVLLAGQPMAAADEPAPAVKLSEQQARAACAAAVQLLGAQRPEGLLGPLVLMTAMEPAPAPVPPLFLDERARGPLVAAQAVAAGNGPLAAAYLRAGLQQGIWLAKPARNPRVDKELLVGIEQRRSIKDAGRHESLAYNYLVLHAHDVSPKDLTAIARTDVFVANLYEDPQAYVGQPVRVTGRMVKLTRMDAPSSLWNDGIKSLYQAWVIPTGLTKEFSYCIVLSELPKNVKMGEKVDYQVTCNAYFFKLNRFQTEERDSRGKVRRDLPLFVGRSIAITRSAPAAEPEESSWSIAAVTHVLPGCLGVVVLMMAFIVGINWWFRRGDRAVQSRIAGTRGTTFVPPPPDDGTADLPIEGPRSRFGAEE